MLPGWAAMGQFVSSKITNDMDAVVYSFMSDPVAPLFLELSLWSGLITFPGNEYNKRYM